MARIDGKIRRWAEQGLITREQQQALSAFERQRAFCSGGMVIILGISVLALGLISIIAANWQYTPPGLKLGAQWLLLAISAYLPWRFQNRPLAFELLLIFYMLCCLAAIGLSAQVFHSSYPLYMGGALWCLMTAGLFWLSQNRFSAFLWLLGAGASALAFWAALDKSDARLLAIVLAMLLSYALLSLIFAFLRKPGVSQAAAALCAVLLLAGALFAELMPISEQFACYEYMLEMRWLLLALLALAGLGVTLAGFYSRGQKIALLLGWFWLLSFMCLLPQRLYLFCYGYDNFHSTNAIGNAAVTFTLLAWLAFYALASGRQYLLLLWLLLAGARVFVIFLLAAYGLMATGLALFLGGGLLIAIPLVWKKVLLPRFFPALNPGGRP
jgi:membrane protein CcdC involved in cytochrome C biogenesis